MSVFGLFGRIFRGQVPGQPISSKTLNGPIGAISEWSRRRVNAGLSSFDCAGIQNEHAGQFDPIYARIIAASGNAGAYTWQRVYQDPTNPANWLDWFTTFSDLDGIDLIYEINGNPNLTAGTRVQIVREFASGKWTFLYSDCSPVTSPSAPRQVRSATPPTPNQVFGRGRVVQGFSFVNATGLQLEQGIPP